MDQTISDVSLDLGQYALDHELAKGKEPTQQDGANSPSRLRRLRRFRFKSPAMRQFFPGHGRNSRRQPCNGVN
jgi:hypothetical protein